MSKENEALQEKLSMAEIDIRNLIEVLNGLLTKIARLERGNDPEIIDLGGTSIEMLQAIARDYRETADRIENAIPLLQNKRADSN